MATGPNYRPNIQLPNLMGHTGDPYDLNLYPQDMIWEKPQGWDESSLGGIEGYTAGVPEGMLEKMSDATYFDERRLDPEGSYPMPAGRDQGPLQYRDPQQYYMENRPYDYDGGWRGPIASTGRYPDDGGYVEYQERYPHPYDSWIGREYSQADLAEEADRKGFLTSEGEHNPMLQRALINQNRANLYDDQGIAGLDTDALEDERVNFVDALEQEDALKKRIRAERSGPVIESDEEQYLDQGITSPSKWQKFLSKITRQPYRPAMGGVTMGSGRTYSPAQLNKMNALGGWYSEPARVQRRTQNRINKMLAAREAGKGWSQPNLEGLTGRDEGRGSYTATPTRSAAAAAAQGIDVGATGMMGPGGKHYMRGGRVGYNTGGRVGILSVF